MSAGEWTTISHVVLCDAPRSFGWDVGLLDRPTASWRVELTPRDTGTDLRQ